MNSILELETEIIKDFLMLEDWDDRYQYLIEFGDKIPMMNPDYKKEQFLVKGCQSKVWLVGNIQKGVVTYQVDGDSPIPKGIAGVIYQMFSGMDSKDVQNYEVKFINEIGLNKFLSPLRLKGANSMINTFKRLAGN